MKPYLIFILFFLLPSIGFAATSLPFNVNMSEAVTVDTTGGTPRISMNVGGVTRYASYVSGTGTSALTFTYAAVVGDVDLDGITLTSPLDLNGGTMKDALGNDATLTFTLPTTTGVKIDYPSMSMNFTNGTTGRYTLNGIAYPSFTTFLTAAGGSFTRGSTATYFDSAGILQTAAAGVPRLDYNPATLAARGLLIEEGRTNVQRSSSAINSADWTRTGITVTTGVTSPDSTANAFKIDFMTGINRVSGNNSVLFNTATIISNPTVGTVYLRASTPADVGKQIYLAVCDTGAATGSATLVTLTATWTRYQVTDSSGPMAYLYLTTDKYSFFTGTLLPAVSVDVFGFQRESASFPTSYIPTAGASASRASEIITMPTGSWFDATQGAMFVSAINGMNSATVGLAALDNSAAAGNDRITIIRIAPTVLEGKVTIAAASQFSSTRTTLGDNLPNKAAVAYQANNFRMAGNNTLGTAGTSGALPTINRLRLGVWGGSAYYGGWISDFKYYPLRVADTQLQLLTQ